MLSRKTSSLMTLKGLKLQRNVFLFLIFYKLASILSAIAHIVLETNFPRNHITTTIFSCFLLNFI